MGMLHRLNRDVFRNADRAVRQRRTATHAKIAAEAEICRNLFPDYRAMRRALPHLTRDQLKYRCYYIAKCARPFPFKLNSREDALMHRLAQQTNPKLSISEIAEKFPRWNYPQVSRALYKRGYRYPRVPERIANKVLDAIRQRAHAMGIGVKGLDRLCNSGGFFKQARRQPTHRWTTMKHVLRALDELGGELVVQWHEVEE